MEQGMKKLLKTITEGIGEMEGNFADFEKMMEDLESSFTKQMDKEVAEFEKKWSDE